ncbi:hypothetical protein ABIE56_002411 [Luteibacter sp. 621]
MPGGDAHHVGGKQITRPPDAPLPGSSHATLIPARTAFPVALVAQCSND